MSASSAHPSHHHNTLFQAARSDIRRASGGVAFCRPTGMRVLLDECIPRKLKSALPGHECQTVPEAGLAGRCIAIPIGRAGWNRIQDLLPHLGAC